MDNKIRVGIAYEGKSDVNPLKIIVTRIFERNNVPFEIVACYPSFTGIIGNVTLYTKRFFEPKGNENSPIDVAIFVTDQDKDPRDKREKHIIDKIRSVNELYLRYSAIGVPDPHFEKWLITDENVVKKILNLDSENSLPLSNLLPKDRLEGLVRSMQGQKIALFEAYEKLASNLNLDTVMGDGRFNKFYCGLLQAVKNYTNDAIHHTPIPLKSKTKYPKYYRGRLPKSFIYKQNKKS